MDELSASSKQSGIPQSIGREFDLRIRRAFFAEGRNIGRREVMLEPAHETGLDMDHFHRYFQNSKTRAAVIEVGRPGKKGYNAHGARMAMFGGGTNLRHHMAHPNVRDGRIISVGKLL